MIVLGYCGGRCRVREIEVLVLRNHPGLFPSEQEISHFLIQVLSQDTE
jgi:hypothetical protein